MQKIRYSRYFKVIFTILDVLVIAGVFLFYFERNLSAKIQQDIWEQNISALILLSFFWILLSGTTKLYSIPRNLTYTLYLERLVTHIAIFIFGVILLAKVSNNVLLNHDKFLVAVNLFLLLIVIKSAIFFTLKYLRSRGLNYRNIMFFPNDSSADVLKNILSRRKDYGFKIFEYPAEKTFDINELTDFWKKHGIHTLYLSAGTLTFDQEKILRREAERAKIRTSIIPSATGDNFFQYDLSYVEMQPILVPTKFPLDFLSNTVLKRTFDIAFSVAFLVFIGTWLFPIIALLIKLDGKGNVFFTQQRYGYHERVFKCLKFRTMCLPIEEGQKTTHLENKRITRVGRFLRKTSLDETPQFLNVLLGDMSVVGPRPHMLLVDDFYKLKIGRYSIRSLVRPGITGLAQVNGLRGDKGDMEINMKKRILTDAFYVKNWSFTLDLVIILKSIFLVIGGDKNAN